IKVKIVKAKVGMQKVNYHLEPGFLEIFMCSDKLLKKISGKISRKLTSEKKDNKFIREEITAPLGLVIIPLTFISNIKNNARLNNKKSIMILSEFYGHKYNDDELQTYISEIVTNAEDI
ncbi:5736_t:CDS:2, partial [Ambispora leptoticha]